MLVARCLDERVPRRAFPDQRSSIMSSCQRYFHEDAPMPRTSLLAKKSGFVIAAALVATMLNPVASSAASSKDPTAKPAGATQILKRNTPGTGPGRPISGASKLVGKPGGATAAATGCHDGASQTSYEGSCDYHEQYQSTGGCESDTTGTSYPGNCANSSDP